MKPNNTKPAKVVDRSAVQRPIHETTHETTHGCRTRVNGSSTTFKLIAYLALTLASSHSSALAQSVETNQQASPIVIIHGAWGGAHHWKGVDRLLTHDHGYNVSRPSLTGQGERVHLASPEIRLKTHISDVVNHIEFEELSSITLIAHSYGGAVASGVVDKIPSRIKRVIYMDAYLLDDGECFFSQYPDDRERLTKRAHQDGDGWAIPVDWKNAMRDVPHPLATLTDPIELVASADAQSHIKSSYWLFTDGGPADDDNRVFYLNRAKDRGYQTRTLPWGHNPQRQDPNNFVKELVSVLD